ISNPKQTDIPWERSTLARTQPSMSLSDANPAESAHLKISATANPARGERWFEGSGHTLAEMLALADAGRPLPRFALKGTLRSRTRIEHTHVESPNVAALLPGSDPGLKNEYVVLTAHLDHLGVGQPIKGDKIYNGAMDDASGVATLIEIARTL